MLVASCLLRKILTSSSPTFEGSSRWARTAFLPVLLVSAFKCLHTGGINIYWVGLRPHQPNIQIKSLPLKLNGATAGDTVAVSAVIYCACMTTIVICFNSDAYSVLCVCELVACIGAGEWMPGTINANCCLSHLIMLVVCSVDGNIMAVVAYLLVLLAWTVPALNHYTIIIKLVLTSLVEETILLLIKFIM